MKTGEEVGCHRCRDRRVEGEALENGECRRRVAVFGEHLDLLPFLIDQQHDRCGCSVLGDRLSLTVEATSARVSAPASRIPRE